jgi:hypothetical protein
MSRAVIGSLLRASVSRRRPKKSYSARTTRPGAASHACGITTDIRSCAALSEPPKARGRTITNRLGRRLANGGCGAGRAIPNANAE